VASEEDVEPDWSLRLDRPVNLPDGQVLSTLGDIGIYATSLPKKVGDLPEWQFAADIIKKAAKREEPVLHALVAFCQALKLPPPPLRTKKPALKYNVIKGVALNGTFKSLNCLRDETAALDVFAAGT
jgi:hypothetical protein